MRDRTFDEPRADAFIGHYDTLMGLARTHVVHAHLLEHLPPPPGAIVDVGGGGGHQSLPLARLGWAVTIVDPSSTMLEEAARAVAALPDEVAARVQLVQGDGEDVPGLLGEGRFDGVLCHGVLGFVRDPDALAVALCSLVRPGGVLSIVSRNRPVQAMRPGMLGDWAAALAAFDAEGDGPDDPLSGTRASDLDTLGALLREHDVVPVAWYGVRLFSEWWRGEPPSAEELPTVLAVELEASRRDPYRRVSRLFHLLARRG